MATIRDAILAEIDESNKRKPAEHHTKIQSTEGLVIEQALNKLFYLKPKIEEEAEFVRLVLSKNGAHQERSGLHASAIISSDSEFCYREQVLSLFYKMNDGKQIQVGLKRIFEEGNAIHEKWQRLFIRGGLGGPEDMDRSRFRKKYDLSYTPDGAPIVIAGHEYVAEIKSVNTFQFKKMHSHPSAKKQVLLYMYLTGIERGFVLCEDKNTQEIKVFVYHMDYSVISPYLERLEQIQRYKKDFLENKRMVERKCSSSECERAQKCNMRDACFNIGKGRIKLKG